MTARRVLGALLATCACVSMLAACEDGNGDDAEPTTSTSSSPTTTEGTSTSTTAFDGGTTPVSAPSSAERTALLRAVRVARQDGFDRVVFEFDDGQIPGYEVAYTEGPVTQAGSGDPVEVEGEALLSVRMTPASGFDIDRGVPTYTGPDRLRTDTGVVTEVVRTGDFEAQLEWVVGLRREVPFGVQTLEDPARVVIDLSAR